MRRFLRTSSTVLHLMLAVGVAGISACGDDDSTGPGNGNGTLLTSGTPLTGRSGAEDSETLYRIVVPAGATNLVVTTAGGTGDVDLYIRAGDPPTPALVDCESEGLDNNENCTVDDPEAGTWYIMLVGFEAYSGVTLTATVNAAAAN